MKKLLPGALALCAFLVFVAKPAFALDAAEPTESPAKTEFAGAGSSIAAGNLYDTITSFRETPDSSYEGQGFSPNHYAYTQEEFMMLATVIHLEVRGEPYAAMLAVGNVVMNRVLSPGYPGDTIREIVTRPNQFCYAPGVTPLPICIQAAKEVLDNEKWVLPQDVYYFRAVQNHSDWGKHRYYKHIGATAFYRDDDYAGRSNNGLIPAALYKRATEWPQYGCVPGLRVARLQKMLITLGYKVDTDGKFDAGTRSALIRFQRNESLVASGVADPPTLKVLITKARNKNSILQQTN